MRVDGPCARAVGQYYNCLMGQRKELSSNVMTAAPALERYQAQLRRLARQLASEAGLVSFVASGSLVRRYTSCGKAGCRCTADPPERHGPYWQWTKKLNGTTVTRRLSDEQAELFQKWVADRRRLRATLAAMEAVSDKAAAFVLKEGQSRTAARARTARSRASG